MYRTEYVGKLDEVLMIMVTLILFKKYSFFHTVAPSSHSPYPIQLLFFDEESRSMPNICRKRSHPTTKILATFASPAPPNWNNSLLPKLTFNPESSFQARRTL